MWMIVRSFSRSAMKKIYEAKSRTTTASDKTFRISRDYFIFKSQFQHNLVTLVNRKLSDQCLKNKLGAVCLVKPNDWKQDFIQVQVI